MFFFFLPTSYFEKKGDRCPQKIAKLCRIFEQNSILVTIVGVPTRDAAGQPGHGSGRVDQILSRVGSGQQISKLSRVGSGHGSAKNFQRVGRVKQKFVTGQAGQEKMCHGSDGSKNFLKNCFFCCKFSKIPPKTSFLLLDIDVFVEKSTKFIKYVGRKIITGQTGQAKK